MPSFESMLVRCFNEFYLSHDIAAMAYKLPQIRYRTQGFDVYSDSGHYEWYSAFECKSIDASEEDMLYFSRYFHVSKGVHQLDNENSIIERSGRIGFLCIELRRRAGFRKSAFLVPWRVVMGNYRSGHKALAAELITSHCELDYSRGGYHITDEVKEAYMNQIGVSKKKKYGARFKKSAPSKVKE